MRLRRSQSGLALVVLGVVGATGSATGQATMRVSVDSSGVQGNGAHYYPSISANGHVVAFESNSFNLVPNDNNGVYDVFVYDRDTGAIKRVSVDSAGVEGNGNSFAARISADGKFVAYMSDADNLVPNDTKHNRDIFVHELATGITERVSVRSTGAEARGFSYEPAISADGRYIAFFSVATNLVPFDTNNFSDVFVHDRVNHTTERVSVDTSGVEGDGDSTFPAISADGSIVAFYSIATNLVPSDTNATFDVFYHDRASGSTVRVSVDSAGNEADNLSYGPSISADGRVIAFRSDATNLVANDANGVRDVFLHDRTSLVTERVSVDSSGFEGDAASFGPSLSSDGELIAFYSSATNLVPGDGNGRSDAFLHHRSTGATERVSVDSTGAESDGDTAYLWLSDDGSTLAFESAGTNLVPNDTNTTPDIFVRCFHSASWLNYGVGWAGTLGVPTMYSSAVPAIGESITITITNSRGLTTPGIVLFGFGQTNLPTTKGGSLLVAPFFFLPLSIPPAGIGLTGTVPAVPVLCGFAADMQTLMVDPGASKGLAFTDGLELHFGH